MKKIMLFALLISSPAYSSYYSYTEWAAMPPGPRATYIAGAFDSLINFSGDQQFSTHYNSCLVSAKMNSGALSANVIEFSKAKPELQTMPPQGALMAYLIAACGSAPTK